MVINRLCIFVLLLVVMLFSGTDLSARSLYWEHLDVTAHLDGDGVMHIRERQHFVFNGAWNGGERIFNIRYGEQLNLQNIYREVPGSGQLIRLKEGDLSQRNHYQWIDNKTLRWRSRMPADPPFQHSSRIYILEYTLSNILPPQGRNRYLLDHDFAFPDRKWPIKKFSLQFSIDENWQPQGKLPQQFDSRNLLPGQGVVLKSVLHFTGAKSPAGVFFGAGQTERFALFGSLMIGAIFLANSFFRHEKAAGRFEPLLPVEHINSEWLNEHVFHLLPEVVGAAWDRQTGAAEVAAVLSRMVGEGKLRSEIRKGPIPFFSRDVLHLELLVDREELDGYEKRLVKALFVDKSNRTDTKRVRKYYKKKGFDPASKIRSSLEKKVKSLTGKEKRVPKGQWKKTFFFILIGVALLAAAAVMRKDEIFPAAVGLGVALFCYVLARVQIITYKLYILHPVLRIANFLLLFLPYLIAVAYLQLSGRPRASIWLLAGFTVIGLALKRSLFENAKTREKLDGVRLRKNLAAARYYFQNELRKRQPTLQDSWFPYLLAFGLGKNIDRWFRAYGKTSQTSSFSGSSGSRGVSPSSWSGGGGSFGGAGASGSWAAAAGAMAAGVSTSSGGGGSSGGSSGGGGGGGW